ncbi:DUF4255 domain-containing protein [Trichocoleus sp. DQ-A3]|uniref:DUF4255 domain-containing protein n=1 Tax=Cyanophyceae TaxID=3028117 RepID=UPI00168706AC|nr:DUF4255 domain-containing protein [Coleofasciculus sp. FACHB-125]MBD1901033.1 DUF4255 domain-containing protein [Coleofasciculus sp. FACHB-125]
MSNYLAIATVTAALQRTLQAVVQIDLDGARVTTVRPSNLGSGTPETGVNIYLYQVSLNPVWRSSADVRNRNRKGEMAKRSHNALDLHYMISLYGNEVELEPQRLLGSVVRTLKDRSTLTQEMIWDTIADSNFTYLADSNLSEQLEEISFVPMDLSLEDLSKVWSVFFQTPYTLSVAYRATVVMIEGEEAAQKALPVREYRFSGVVPFSNQPVIQEVVSQAGRFQAILADSTLLIRGKNLNSNITRVRLGEVEATPSEVHETQVTLPLSAFSAELLRAGVQSLQVIHHLSSPSAPVANGGVESNGATSRGNSTPALSLQPALQRSVESNVAPFVLRPTITEVSITDIQGSGDELRSANLTLQVNLTIGNKQRVVVALNERSIDNPGAYLFDALPRRADTTSVIIPVRDVKPGEYLVRVHVDGAESMLSVDTDKDSPTFQQYIDPKVTIV